MVVTLRALVTLPIVFDRRARCEQGLATWSFGLHRDVQLLVLLVLGEVSDVRI